jgi:hypothetical protein
VIEVKTNTSLQIKILHTLHFKHSLQSMANVFRKGIKITGS